MKDKVKKIIKEIVYQNYSDKGKLIEELYNFFNGYENLKNKIQEGINSRVDEDFNIEEFLNQIKKYKI